MFDKITIDKIHLPEKYRQFGDVWVTKSFNNVLDRYKIDAEGQLWHKDLFKTYAQFSKLNITTEIVFYAILDAEEVTKFKAKIENGFFKSLEQIFLHV